MADDDNSGAEVVLVFADAIVVDHCFGLWWKKMEEGQETGCLAVASLLALVIRSMDDSTSLTQLCCGFGNPVSYLRRSLL